ncbi:DgyrCDS5058 [Dimorphilus gyrociliatus]|uniref:DgyrCDS5058 n=1 Tax=Dimorphilus gyrociliatus TaxID=2664684 RepID=A0A7I8VNH7_9ANNE|nr:DgyrCDS5058 [Dimorphilus gyrociliatus]
MRLVLRRTVLIASRLKFKFNQTNVQVVQLIRKSHVLRPLRLSFTFLPFAFRRGKHNERSDEIIANIPKEVFAKETIKKRIDNIFIKIYDFIKLFWRGIRLSLTFGPLLIVYPVFSLSESLQHTWLKIFLRAVEISGPTVIKFGQWASTRRDLFSDFFCDLFSKLHDECYKHSWRATKRKLHSAFGPKWREIFIHVEKVPVGSGCVGQCHKAYMRANMIPDEDILHDINFDSESDEAQIDYADGLELIGFGRREDDDDDEDNDEGDEDVKLRSKIDLLKSKLGEDEPEPVIIPVAVKVLHPGIYGSVQRDLKIISYFARICRKIIPSLQWIAIEECVEEFTKLMTKQIDLRFEAKCLEEFSQNFEDIPYIRFPRVIRPFCKRNVMVETFEEGEPISNFLSDSIDCDLKEDLANYGIEALLKMIFIDNFVHGDLHPGNILVQNAEAYLSNKQANKVMLVDIGDTLVADVKPAATPLKLVLLDVGITSSLEEYDLDNFKAVFTSIIQGEGEHVADLMLKHAPHHQCKNENAFRKELGTLVNQFRENSLTLTRVNVSLLLGQVFQILTKHKVKLESNFASIMIAMFIVEGLGRSLYPEINLIEKAKPFVLGQVAAGICRKLSE